MKKILVCLLLVVLIFAGCMIGAVTPLQNTLVSMGFEKHDDIWILSDFYTGPDKTDRYVVAWYDAEKNYGVMSSKEVIAVETDSGEFRFNDSYDYVIFSYDSSAERFVTTESFGYRY